VFFVTQNPLDIPDKILGQLGNRVQHALRAFTPRDQKAVKAAAETLRANPKIDAETAITELGVGEALVSFLDDHGRPCVVERAFILPPASRIGPLTPEERTAAIKGSLLFGHYEKTVDRESAYEKLKAPATQAAPTSAPAPAPEAQTSGGGLGEVFGDIFGGGGGRRQSAAEAAIKSAARSIGSQLGREIVRGVLGSILGGRRR
jgi:DNA helicase HerA-like ATPase